MAADYRLAAGGLNGSSLVRLIHGPISSLEFERGGKVDVKMVVQVPKSRSGEAAAPKH
jgi:hypothetical protein